MPRTRKTVWILGATALSGTVVAQAHAGNPHPGGSVWNSWNTDPFLINSLATAALAYATGVRNLWAKAGKRRGIPVWQVLCFSAGMCALALALISPIDRISAELSSMHMVQHMFMMNIAAPLLVLGSPALAFAWALPPRNRIRLGTILRRFEGSTPARRLLGHPLFLWLVYGATLWTWHLPRFYQSALRNDWVHEVQHLCFLLVSYSFWKLLLDPVRRCHFDTGVGVFYLFTTSLHATLLGVFMALSPRVWYRDYEATVHLWNLTPIEDQQLAGLIMWMPACAIYATVAATLFVLWIRKSQANSTQTG